MTEKKNKITNLGAGADSIWEEIKNKKVEMFALPGQLVENLFQPFAANPNVLHLNYNISSALPALEAALGPSFVVELAGKYITVSRVAK